MKKNTAAQKALSIVLLGLLLITHQAASPSKIYQGSHHQQEETI